jgi:ClpP class serine protease
VALNEKFHSGSASGKDKGTLDPFQPERPDDVARLKELQRDVHDVFIGIVKERRAARLKGTDDELFNGAFWSAAKALDYGLIDGIADLRSKMQQLHGQKVRLRAISTERGGLLSRFRRLPGINGGFANDGIALPASLTDDLISTVEARALWSRFGF